MKKKAFDIFIWIATLSFVIGIFFLPDKVPVHWGFNGQIDRYGSRYEVLILAFLPILIYYGMFLTKKIDPKRDSFQGREKTYELLRKGLACFFVILCGFLYYMTINPHVNLAKFIVIFVGILFIVLGNYMPKLPQNFFVGIRTPWAISNQDVWRKTQKVGGYSFVLAGILMTMWVLFDLPYLFWMIMVVSFGIVIFDCSYSYVIYKKIERK